jgi:hypothetical protein
MNIIHRTREAALISVTSAELEAIEQALATSTSSTAAQECLARLRKDLGSRPVLAEHDILNVRADGAAVLVRAISVYSDPVDMSSEEARAFAQRILDCANEAD